MAMKKAGKGPSIEFAKGGSGKMSGKNESKAQAPGITSNAGKSTGKFPMGGKGHMAGKGSASPARPK